jgi:hypothetical protein
MVEITAQKIDSLAPLLERISPETASALRRYENRPHLFEWKELISRLAKASSLRQAGCPRRGIPLS